jgi:hypothetical protein
MAKVWEYDGRDDYPVVVEDPRSANDGFYINGLKHNKTSLTPQYNRMMNFRYDTVSSYLRRHYNNINTGDASIGSSLALAKMQTGCGVPNNGQGILTHIDPSPWIDMSQTGAAGEGGYTGGAMQALKSNDGTQEAVAYAWQYNGYNYHATWPEIASSVDLDQQNPNASGNYQQNYNRKTHWWGKAYGSSQQYQPGLSRGMNSSQNYNYPNFKMHITYGTSGWPNDWPNQYITDVSGMGNTYTVQFLGESSDNGILWAGSSTNNTDIRVVKALWSNSHGPSQTALLHYTATPAAGGSHQGGNNRNSLRYATSFSTTFDDPRGTANTKCFYRSYYDSYYNWHPVVVTWDTSNDTFAVETDITTDVNSSVHADVSTIPSDTVQHVTMHWATVTWVSSGTRYVSEFKCDGRNQYWDNNAGFRTWVTYAVGASDPKSLTYHSKIEMPFTPRQYVWLNDSRTLMGVWFSNAFKVYSWNNSTGWTETTSVGSYIHECGRDSLDRIWYTKPSTVYGSYKPELHLLTPTLPVSITVTPENASYTYAGSNITTYVNVSAINASGARIATSVKLVIEGSSMTFTDGSTQKTVTTQTSGELQVGTTVTGAGFTNVAASIEI